MCVCDHCGGSIEAHESRFVVGQRLFCDAYCFKKAQENEESTPTLLERFRDLRKELQEVHS